MPTLPPDVLSDYVTRIFAAVGASDAEARDVAEHLVGANLRGHDSHGVIRVEGYVQMVQNGLITPGAPVEIERESETTAVVDGHWNFGQVVARRTMEIAVEKARSHGVGIVAGHCSAHIGRVGAYGEQAAAAGLIAICAVNNHGAGRLVAPFGGAERRLSTNPIVIAGPTSNPDEPFVLDMATSGVAEGKVRVARNRGVPLAADLLIDANGEPTTDPWDLYGGDPPGSRTPGALLPLGGAQAHKGFGLSMAVELLAGALTPAGCSRADAERRGGNGIFMMAFDPERFVGRGPFEQSMSALVDFVKQPPFRPGVAEVLTAGEPERRRMADRLKHGVELDDETWRQIAAAARSVGVDPPEA